MTCYRVRGSSVLTYCPNNNIKATSTTLRVSRRRTTMHTPVLPPLYANEPKVNEPTSVPSISFLRPLDPVEASMAAGEPQANLLLDTDRPFMPTWTSEPQASGCMNCFSFLCTPCRLHDLDERAAGDRVLIIMSLGSRFNTTRCSAENNTSSKFSKKVPSPTTSLKNKSRCSAIPGSRASSQLLEKIDAIPHVSPTNQKKCGASRVPDV